MTSYGENLFCKTLTCTKLNGGTPSVVPQDNLTVTGLLKGGSLAIANNILDANGTGVGFFGTAPIAKQNVPTGADAATTVASLIAALVAYGVITNT